MKKHKIITCAGYGGTGSSIITDLLKEFDNVKSMGEFEFSIAHDMDGISDLQHYIVDDFHRNKVAEGIYRFKRMSRFIEQQYNTFFNGKFMDHVNQYIDNLVDVEWMGYWHQHSWRESTWKMFYKYNLPYSIKKRWRKVIHRNDKYEYEPSMPLSMMYISYGKERFYSATRNFFNGLFDEMDPEFKYEYLALDQLVPPYTTERYTSYFPDLKTIIIDRDPRDLYLLNKIYWKVGYIPYEDINIFIEWYKLTRQHKQNETVDENNVLKIQFEDCIYQYDKTIKTILDFIGINECHHTNPKTCFNPEFSSKNTKLWEMHPEFISDCELIKRELNQYCYNYK